MKKDGLFVNYWDNGNKEQEGNGKDDKKMDVIRGGIGMEKTRSVGLWTKKGFSEVKPLRGRKTQRFGGK